MIPSEIPCRQLIFGPVMLLQSHVNKVMFLLKSMLTCDEPLLSGQSPLRRHFPVPCGWSLNKHSTGR